MNIIRERNKKLFEFMTSDIRMSSKKQLMEIPFSFVVELLCMDYSTQDVFAFDLDTEKFTPLSVFINDMLYNGEGVMYDDIVEKFRFCYRY